MSVRASIMIPTTGDRGSLLSYSVTSALRQTVADIEVIIVGDGVSDDTRLVIQRLVEADDRVRFFDHPKHARRGEPYRHRILTDEARGRIVTYLCDRDLYLPDHVAEIERLLTHADFGYSYRVGVSGEGQVTSLLHTDLAAIRGHDGQQISTDIPLSFAGHTIDAYRRLPYGWRTTPTDEYTDQYMWRQFLDQPWCRIATGHRPTALWFSTAEHGSAPAGREALLGHWARRVDQPDVVTDLLIEILEVVDLERATLGRRLRRRSLPGLLEAVLPAYTVRTLRRVKQQVGVGSIASRFRPRS